MNPECRICHNNRELKEYIVKEKHFATFEEFKYFECPYCGTLQISEIPEDIGKFYSGDYYSKIIPERSALKKFLKKCWHRHYTRGFNLFGMAMARLKGEPEFYNWFGKICAKPDDSILDVGSGIGILLSELNLAGYNNLTGIDPYINASIDYPRGYKIIKGSLDDLTAGDNKFKQIIFNNSFEHLPDPLGALKTARKLQEEAGNLIIRIPIAGSYAWEKYGADWVSLDPPRHFHILSVKAMEILAKEASYKVIDILYDSSDFQFWGSELYRHNIPLTATKFGSKDPMSDFRDIVSEEQSEEFRRLSKKLNEEKRSDQATFYLKPV